MIWVDGILDWDLTIGGVEMDLAGVCVTVALLTGDRDTRVFLLLGFENESSWYWNLPIEDSLISSLGMNYNNIGVKPDVEWSRVAKCLDMILSKAWKY